MSELIFLEMRQFFNEQLNKMLDENLTDAEILEQQESISMPQNVTQNSEIFEQVRAEFVDFTIAVINSKKKDKININFNLSELSDEEESSFIIDLGAELESAFSNAKIYLTNRIDIDSTQIQVTGDIDETEVDAIIKKCFDRI